MTVYTKYANIILGIVGIYYTYLINVLLVGNLYNFVFIVLNVTLG